MARCVEFLLYRSASSLQEYSNPNTLLTRMHLVALQIHKKHTELAATKEGTRTTTEKY